MKKLFLSCMLLISYNSLSTTQTQQNAASDKDLQLLEEALEIIASMSDNIANLAIQHKAQTNSPEMTKQQAVALVEKITDLVIVIIKKVRLKKNSRNIALHSQEELDAIIDHIADEILNKNSVSLGSVNKIL